MSGATLGEVRRELVRLYGLPDRFLGRALLDLSRRAIEADPKLGVDPQHRGYESLLIMAILPRLAIELGETRLTTVERAGARAAPRAGHALRSLTGTCLNNAGFRLFVESPDPQLRALSLGFANGSPITIGLDRVSPPQPNSDDWVATHIREISRARFGDERFSAWAPTMQDYPGKSRHAFKRRLVTTEAADPDPDDDATPSP